jgi:carboxymethylenebutenolidase
MAGDTQPNLNQDHDDTPDDPSRRDFVTLSLAAGLAVATGSAAVAATPVTETDVTIKTPDGTCDAAFIHPAAGAHPGIILWTDAFGLRRSMREMAKKLAADGYSVLVPNPFYRVAKAPIWDDASTVDFNKERDKLMPLMGSVNAAGAVEKDAAAFIAWLDQQPSVNKAKKIGTQGYCMGGALVVRTAAIVPDRVGAGASFHGGGLVTPQPTSPHLLAPKIKAKMYFGIASTDDKAQPDAKDKLKQSFDGARNPATVEVYKSAHGWCVPDMPPGPEGPIYNKPEAEQAWSKLLVLYKAALA